MNEEPCFCTRQGRLLQLLNFLLGGITFYGKPDYKKLMPLVLKIMLDIPREFLRDFIPDKSYKTFQAWQTGKRKPKSQDLDGLIEAMIAWARENTPNSVELSASELLRAYIVNRKALNKRARRMVKKLPDSVLHHKVGLNTKTIKALRTGADFQMTTLRRIEKKL